MTHPTDQAPTAGKIRVRKDGNRWQVEYPCDCPDLSVRRAPIPARRKRLTRTVR